MAHPEATFVKGAQYLSRRAVLGFGPVALTSCISPQRHFGNTIPPQSQTLIYEISSEPSTFDPARMLGSGESSAMNALLECLVKANPETLEPEAALATHYEVNASATEFVFYLRGHPNPKGIQLPDVAASAPALWSDGARITAYDFALAWQRCVDPENACIDAISFYLIAGAEEINSGKAEPQTLGVRAEGDLTFRVTLHRPAGHFLKLTGTSTFAAVPRHLFKTDPSRATGESWAQPHRMVTSGAFVLQSWKPNDSVVLCRNPRYYDAARVKLERIILLPVSDGATSVNLYRAGDAHATHGRAVPPLLIPRLRGKKDFRSFRALRILCHAFNTTQPPFDNVLVRYAFNMATDKNEIAQFLGAGQIPARGVIPPVAQYAGPQTLSVEVRGREYDVLAYNPEHARELLSVAARRKLVLTLTVPARPRSRDLAQILQKQWSTQLGAHIKIVTTEWNVWVTMILGVSYTGMIESGVGSDYGDPNLFFEFFSDRRDGSGWSDPEFNSSVDRANAVGDPVSRMSGLAECEKRVLRAMPVLPICFDVYTFLQKPYVRGQLGNSIDTPRFSDVSIDTDWRPQ